MKDVVHQFNWADFFIVGVILISTLVSLGRGLVREAISLLTWVLAIWLGIKFSPLLANMMINVISTPSLRLITAFIILFLSAIIVGGVINFMIGLIIEKTGLGIVNRLAGTIFGFLRGVLLVSVMILIARHTAIPQDSWWTQARLIPTFEPIADKISSMMPEKVHKVSQILFVPTKG